MGFVLRRAAAGVSEGTAGARRARCSHMHRATCLVRPEPPLRPLLHPCCLPPCHCSTATLATPLHAAQMARLHEGGSPSARGSARRAWAARNIGGAQAAGAARAVTRTHAEGFLVRAHKGGMVKKRNMALRAGRAALRRLRSSASRARPTTCLNLCTRPPWLRGLDACGTEDVSNNVLHCSARRQKSTGALGRVKERARVQCGAAARGRGAGGAVMRDGGRGAAPPSTVAPAQSMLNSQRVMGLLAIMA